MKKFFSNRFEHLNLLKDNHGLDNILHFAVDCRKNNKHAALKNVLSYSLIKKILIFASGKPVAKDIEKSLKRLGFSTLLLTSENPVSDRLDIIKSFKKSSKKILVLNYPQGHGIDFGTDLLMIINYDLPLIDNKIGYEYFHKVSKTGRSKRPGKLVYSKYISFSI